MENEEDCKNEEVQPVENENKYKKIFENVQDVYYRTDLNGIILEVSPSVKKYAHYFDSDLPGRSIESYYYNPDDRTRIIKEIFEKGEIFDTEVRLKAKDNSIRWASLNAHLTFDQNGQITGIEGMIRDISERKQTEEKLKHSLSLLQATLNSTTEGILVVDNSGKITSYNSQFSTLFNIPEQILESSDDSKVLEYVLNQFKDTVHFFGKVQYLYNHPELESFDTLELKDGRVLERNSCPQLLDGEPIGRVWSFKNVTLRKKAESQLQLMAHAIKSINEFISISDNNNKLIFVNEAFLKHFGYTKDELIGKEISIVRSPKNDPEIINQILKITSEKSWQGEIWGRKKDGTDFSAYLSTTTVKNENNDIIGIVGVSTDITDRLQAEKDLKESEERYHSFFDGSPDAIFLADIETEIIIDANQAASRLLRRPLHEIIGINQTQIHPPEDYDHSKKVFKEDTEKALKSEPRATENFVFTSDGEKVPVEVLASLIHVKGKPVLQGVFRDISARKNAEQALQESEQRYRQLIENQGEGVTIVDTDENFIFANPAAELIFEVQAGGLTNRNLREFVLPEQIEKIRSESQKRSKNEKSIYEIDIRTANGVLKNLLVTATTQKDSQGKCEGTFGVLRDITDQKKAEEMLRQSEQKYRNLIEIMPDGVYRSTPEGKFVEVNPAMVSILGYDSKEELMGIDIKTQLYFDPADRESLSLKMNNEELDVFPLKKKDGSAVYVEDHGWWVKNEKGEVVLHEGISRDVTERKMAEFQLQKYSQELQELNATKDKFFSIIAHDLKSPFNSIAGLSELIKKEARFMDVETIEQFAGVIHSTSANTFKLLENLLEWASLQQSNIVFRPESVILRNVVGEVIDLSFEKASCKKIEVINDIAEGMIIIADKNMLKTVLRNLISNALKFTPTNGQVRIRAISKNEHIEIQVIDNGVGIKTEDCEKLFKIGSNYSQRGTENEKGTGIGLMLCKEFIEKHGGEIWVESVEGKGSTFAFTIKQIGS